MSNTLESVVEAEQTVLYLVGRSKERKEGGRKKEQEKVIITLSSTHILCITVTN